MKKLGVIEGFFGQPWGTEGRLGLFDFMKAHGLDFYFYAPKQDALLRTKWRDDWNADYLSHLRFLSENCRLRGLHFGVGLSPYSLGKRGGMEADLASLAVKVRQLHDIGIDILGLFFDDMHGHPDIAADQIRAVNSARDLDIKNIAFCPSYYTYDALLDRAFGQRPAHYLEDLGAGIPAGVDIIWTGPQVISTEISAEHLNEVAVSMKRPPFIWDNLFANDGPVLCKFLKLRPFAGRSNAALQASSGWGINPMNQIEMSKIVILASKKTAVDGMPPDEALIAAVRELTSAPLAERLIEHIPACMDLGLDKLTAEQKKEMVEKFRPYQDEVAAVEVIDWLEGKYHADLEIETDEA